MRNSARLRPIHVVIMTSIACGFSAQALCQPPACTMSGCDAPMKWFVDGKTPKVSFGDFPKVDDVECAFYRWAWQSFLYLTQSERDGEPPRFVLFNTENELFDTAGGKDLQVAAAPARAPGKQHVLSLSVRNSPHTSREISAKSIEQAGSHGVVVDHNQRCLYYGMHFNSVYVSYIRDQLGLKSADDIPNVPLTEEFPVGSIELKSSWRALTDDEKKEPVLANLRKSWFITEAEVPTLSEADISGIKVVKADATRPRPEMVALVGLHVVGVTPGHHEFVWASFEHIENSPTPVRAGLGLDDPIDNTKEFTFYKKGTKRKDANVNPVDDGATTPPVPLKLVDSVKQTLLPVVEIYRAFNSDEDGIKQDTDVCTLNASVRVKLAASPTLSVWSNYHLIGAVWLRAPADDFKPGVPFPMPPKPAPGVTPPPPLFAGEMRLSNSTMETFTQTTKVNCFACHNTQPANNNGKHLPGLKIKISHAIRNSLLGPE